MFDGTSAILFFVLRQEVDSTKPIKLSFNHWLESICTTLKYKKELSKSRITSGEAANDDGTKPREFAGIEVENVRMDLQRILRTATEGAAGLLALATSSSQPLKAKPAMPMVTSNLWKLWATLQRACQSAPPLTI